MTVPRNSKKLLAGSVLALVLTLGLAAAAGYSAFSNRAVRWGDSLIIGPRFTGDISLDGGVTRMRFWRENGVPALDAPSWKGRGPITMTFLFGFTIYHTPPGTLGARTSGR
jgi:hypothetical protein